MDGRWNHLRDVAGGPVILGTATLMGSSSLFGWISLDRLRGDIAVDFSRVAYEGDSVEHCEASR